MKGCVKIALGISDTNNDVKNWTKWKWNHTGSASYDMKKKESPKSVDLVEVSEVTKLKKKTVELRPFSLIKAG